MVWCPSHYRPVQGQSARRVWSNTSNVRGSLVPWQATKRPEESPSTLRLASHMFPVLRMVLEKP